MEASSPLFAAKSLRPLVAAATNPTFSNETRLQACVRTRNPAARVRMSWPWMKRSKFLKWFGSVSRSWRRGRCSPDCGVAAVGSGGKFAESAALALTRHTDMGAEEIGGTDEASVETLVQALVDTIADVTGVPVSMDSSGAEGGEEDVEADLDMGEPAELEGGDELGGDELGAVEDEPVPGGRDYMEEDQLVAEVARRVAARLAKKARKEQLADTLAERIMDRLTK